MSSFRSALRRQAYCPRWYSVPVNPYFIARHELVRELRALAAGISGRVLLDVGCGVKPYEAFFDVEHYVGLEPLVSGHQDASKRNDLFFDGRSFPIASSSIDIVLCSQVFEHVFEPARFLAEIHRVLKAQGSMILTVPFVWDEHEQPYDFARYTSFGLTHLFRNAGFRIVEMRKTGGYLKTLAQMASSYAFTQFGGRFFVTKALVAALVCCPLMLLGLLLSGLLPTSKLFYLDNVVLARKN